MLCSRDSTMSADRFHCEQDENKSGKSVPLRAHRVTKATSPTTVYLGFSTPDNNCHIQSTYTSYICIQDTNCTPAPAPARMLNHVTWRDRPAGHVVNSVPTQTATCRPNCHMRRQVSNMHDCELVTRTYTYPVSPSTSTCSLTCHVDVVQYNLCRSENIIRRTNHSSPASITSQETKPTAGADPRSRRRVHRNAPEAPRPTHRRPRWPKRRKSTPRYRKENKNTSYKTNFELVDEI